MGNCSSCLGRGGRDVYDEEEEAPLFDDPNSLQYGSFGDQYMNGQDDSLVAQREVEALQRVVAKASDSMVDIFEIAPPETAAAAPTPFAYAGQEARIVRYQHLLSKLGGTEAGEAAAASVVQVDWLPQDEDPIELQRGHSPATKADPGAALVGTFADAAAAMA